MNKKGIAFLYYLMLGMVIIILGIALAYPTKQPIDDARTELSCSNPSNDFDQGTCWIMDGLKILVVGLFVTVGGFVWFKL